MENKWIRVIFLESEPLRYEGDSDSAKVPFPSWFLICQLRQLGNQLLGGRYRQDFQVPEEEGARSKRRIGERGILAML